MNAYELADELEKFESFNGDIFFGTCAIMLRQQADQLDKVIPQLVKANGLIENLRIRIKELEDVLSTYELRDLNNTSRIAELERTLAIMEGEYPEPTIFAKITEFNSLEEAYKRIAELEKENKELHAIAQRMAMAESDARKSLQNFKDKIPNEDSLRIKPVYIEKKQLSDEEIKDIGYKFGEMGVNIQMIRAIIKEITE